MTEKRTTISSMSESDQQLMSEPQLVLFERTCFGHNERSRKQSNKRTSSITKSEPVVDLKSEPECNLKSEPDFVTISEPQKRTRLMSEPTNQGLWSEPIMKFGADLPKYVPKSGSVERTYPLSE